MEILEFVITFVLALLTLLVLVYKLGYTTGKDIQRRCDEKDTKK